MTIETTHILLKRGNTSQSLTYTGPLGEVTIDTDLRSLRVHDGVTPGGNLVSSGTGISSTNQLVNGNKTVSLASTGLTTFPTFQTGNASLSIQGAIVGSTNAGLSILAKNEVLISADLLGTVKNWIFGTDGTTTFPTLTVPISDNATPNGTGQTIKFSDSSQQAIIFGPASTGALPSAERIIIQGAPGYTGTTGEGGDIYLWAGPGGSVNGDGGDIKVRAGYGPGSGQGGYLNFQAGDTATGAGGHINIESGESGTYGSGGDITVQARSGGEITLRTYGPDSKDWQFGADGALTLPSGYPILFGNGNSRIQAGMGFHINSEEGISLEAVDATDPLLPVVHQWHFGTDGALNSPGGSFTKTTNNYLANNVTTQVVWTSTQNGISGVKLTIQVECDETGGVNYPNWETQVCEAIIAVRGYDSVSEPVMSVYGVTHTSVEPLMTFSVQRNPTTFLIEMVGTRTATASPLGGADLRIYSVETGTND